MDNAKRQQAIADRLDAIADSAGICGADRDFLRALAAQQSHGQTYMMDIHLDDRKSNPSDLRYTVACTNGPTICTDCLLDAATHAMDASIAHHLGDGPVYITDTDRTRPLIIAAYQDGQPCHNEGSLI